MKNRFSPTLFIVLIFSAADMSAQKNFTPARWTKPDGSQTDILIDFRQWETMPATIRYKIAEGGSEQHLPPTQVRVLRVQADPEEIYIGRETDVAVFSDAPSESAEVARRRKVIFLRALVLGSLNLYKYHDENGIRHYFIEKDTIWEELIYHDYYTDTGQKQTRAHHRFRTQLLRATFDCAALAEQIRNLSFREKSLVGAVSDYNSSLCNGQLVFREQKARDKFQIGIRAGGAVTFNKIGFEFGSKYSGQNNYFRPKFGIGALYFLPRSLHSKALLVDLMYDQQTYETTLAVPTRIKEDFIQVHLSMRQYFQTDRIAPFVNGGLFFGFPVGEEELMEGWTYDYSPSAQAGLSLGGGARWNRLEAETRLIANHLLGIQRGGVTSSLTWIFTLGYWLN